MCNNAACARLGAEQAHIRLRSSKQALVCVAVEHKVEGKTSMLMMISSFEDDAEEMAQRRLETILGARLSVILGIRPSAQSDA